MTRAGRWDAHRIVHRSLVGDVELGVVQGHDVVLPPFELGDERAAELSLRPREKDPHRRAEAGS